MISKFESLILASDDKSDIVSFFGCEKTKKWQNHYLCAQLCREMAIDQWPSSLWSSYPDTVNWKSKDFSRCKNACFGHLKAILVVQLWKLIDIGRSCPPSPYFVFFLPFLTKKTTIKSFTIFIWFFFWVQTNPSLTRDKNKFDNKTICGVLTYYRDSERRRENVLFFFRIKLVSKCFTQ